MPDDVPLSTHVTLRVPGDVVEAFDRLAKILDRPRSWVMIRAFRAYLEAEGADLSEDAYALAELDAGGETVPGEEVVADIRQIIEASERRRTTRR
jgi:predicted transcriptional regulator